MQMPSGLGTIHIIGVGGIGMSAIAEILNAQGFTVQGSDQKESANVRRLREKGIRVFVGHNGINLVGAKFVVISTAVKDNNPELQAAREKGLPIIRRSEMLAELMRLYATISVTGTHGKTTTTSLTAHVLESASADPTVITGGIINSWGSNARLGQGRWMIVEADESDGTFVKIPSQIGVVTNIDPEHLDFFGSVQHMHAAYEQFFKNIPFYGLTVACIDHPVVRQMIDRLNLRRDGRRMVTYGRSTDADIVLEDVRIDGLTTTFSARIKSGLLGPERKIENWSVPLPGEHVALNALAAFAVAAEAELTDDQIRDGMATFSGVKRRFQKTGDVNGVGLFDDYGHHPIEIAAVLRAAREGAKGRLFAVVEPHRYSRVKSLFNDFCGCVKDADGIIVAPLYSAGEAPIETIDHHALARGMTAQGSELVLVADAPSDIAPLLARVTEPGDTVIFFGAGHSTDWAHAMPTLLAEELGVPALTGPSAGPEAALKPAETPAA
ncbi:MAG: UDP-N-acetylmuramate--L-alanine ligase [Pseudomonadota bacterium]